SFTVYENQLSCVKDNEDGSTVIITGNCNDFNGLDLKWTKCSSIQTCRAVENFLNHLQSMNKASYTENGCKYMYYWLYVVVLDSKPSHSVTIELYKDLINRYDNTTIFDKCKNQWNEKKFEKLIKILTLYNNFNKVYPTLHEGKCERANECVSTYMGYIEECANSDDKDFVMN
ncbi:hypothetical protein PCYB_006670, partial [Plasmodium cynomolgi strain B]